MLKFLERAADVVIYGDVDIDFGVVPFQVDSTVKGAVPLDCAFIVEIDCVDEVIFVVLGELLHSEVVNAKDEGCFAGAVFPEAWCVLHWVIFKG